MTKDTSKNEREIVHQMVRLDPVMHRAVRLQSVYENRPASQIIRDAISDYLVKANAA